MQKVEVGKGAAVPIIELGEQRVNAYNFLVSVSPHQTKVAMLRYMESLTDVMDPADFSNSAETRLAVSTGYLMDQGSKESRDQEGEWGGAVVSGWDGVGMCRKLVRG